MNDYYPFGMQMPGRKFSAAGSGYRYGFNGKELDKEVTSGTTYDYGFRIYNPALARFLSVDPLTKSYPMLTPYQFGSNRPIDGIDLDGLEWKESTKTFTNEEGYLMKETVLTVTLRVVNNSKVMTGEAKTKEIAENIAASTSKIFGNHKIDEDSKEFRVFKTNVILDYTPLKEGETPTVDNGFWLVLNDKKTEVRVSKDGDEQEVLVGGSALPGYINGRTQKNIANVSVSLDGQAINAAGYSRSGSHEIGHTGGLPHPWMTSENLALGITDVNEKDVNERTIRGNKKYIENNIMNSQEAGASYPNASGTEIRETQLQSMTNTVNKGQAAAEKEKVKTP